MGERTIGGRYRLAEPLGTGGMAAVWAAADLELERLVAVKLLAPDADRARFEREARLLATLNHPHVLHLFDYGEDGGTPFMVLEHLAGGSLQDLLRVGEPLPDETTARVAAEIASGLAAAHAQGLVHRDLKPANILFDAEGRAKLADFGIARAPTSGTLTDPGTVLGTAAYISPEQAAGEPATAASDVYAFGVILYRLLTGRLPFESDDAAELVCLHRDEPPATVSELRPDAPPVLAGVALAALAKDPAARPPDGAALLDALRAPAAAAQEAAEATAVIVPRRPGRPGRVAAVMTAAVLLAAAGIALALVARAETDTPVRATRPERPTRPVTTAAEAPPPSPPSTAGTTEPPPPAPTPPAPTTAQTTAPAPIEPPPTVETTPPITEIPTEPAPTEPAATEPPPVEPLPPPTEVTTARP